MKQKRRFQIILYISRKAFKRKKLKVVEAGSFDFLVCDKEFESERVFLRSYVTAVFYSVFYKNTRNKLLMNVYELALTFIP